MLHHAIAADVYQKVTVDGGSIPGRVCGIGAIEP